MDGMQWQEHGSWDLGKLTAVVTFKGHTIGQLVDVLRSMLSTFEHGILNTYYRANIISKGKQVLPGTKNILMFSY